MWLAFTTGLKRKLNHSTCLIQEKSPNICPSWLNYFSFYSFQLGWFYAFYYAFKKNVCCDNIIKAPEFFSLIKPEALAFIIMRRRSCCATINWWCMLKRTVLLQWDRTVCPINIMRMNHRVVLFLMVCNGLSADSIMVIPTFHFTALSNHYI